MAIKQSRSFLLAAVVASVLGLVPLQARAADTANTLKVTPVRTDLTANPGETKTVDILITNPSKSSVTVRAIENHFVAGDETGTPALILDENEFAPKHSLKRFMTPPQNVTLEPSASKTVPVTIAVPKTATAGGYCGALRFAPTAPNDGGQVNLSASVASLILLRVNGPASEKLTLTDFAIQQQGSKKAFFTDTKDLDAFIRFKNDGDTQLCPIGKISAKKGDKVVSEADFNTKDMRDMILPDSARRWTVSLKNLDGFGRYAVSATFTYGSKNQTVSIDRTFWVVPMSMIIIAGIGLLLVIALIVFIVVRLRRNRRSLSLGARR